MPSRKRKGWIMKHFPTIPEEFASPCGKYFDLEFNKRRAVPIPFAHTTTTRASCSWRSEEHTSELQSRSDLVCRLLLEKKKDAPYDAILHEICNLTPGPDSADVDTQP